MDRLNKSRKFVVKFVLIGLLVLASAYVATTGPVHDFFGGFTDGLQDGYQAGRGGR